MSTAVAEGATAVKPIGQYEEGDTVALLSSADVQYRVLSKDGPSVTLERITGKFAGKKHVVPADSLNYAPVGKTATREQQVEKFSSLMGDKKSTTKKAEPTKPAATPKPAPRGRTLLTLEQVAGKSSKTIEQVEADRKAGKLKGTNVGGSGRHADFRFHPDDVSAYLKSNRKERQEAAKKAEARPKKPLLTPTDIVRDHAKDGIELADVRRAIRSGELKARNTAEEGKTAKWVSTPTQVQNWLDKRARRTAKASQTRAAKAERVPGDVKNRGVRLTDKPSIPADYQRAKNNPFDLGARTYCYLEVMRAHKGKVPVKTLIEETVAMRQKVFGIKQETAATVKRDLENQLNWWQTGNKRGGGIVVEIDSSPCQLSETGRYRKNEKQNAIVVLKGVERD